MLSLFPGIQISLSQAREWFSLDNTNDINTLYRKGWIGKDNNAKQISIHPIIASVIRYKAKMSSKKTSHLMEAFINLLTIQEGEISVKKSHLLMFAISLVLHIDRTYIDGRELATTR